MRRNYQMLILCTVLLVVGLGALGELIYLLPDYAGIQVLAGFAYLALVFWLAFDMIVKIIYKFAGATSSIWQKKPQRLTHQQAKIVQNCWIIWLVTAELTMVIITLLFDREDWKQVIFYTSAFVFCIVLGFISSNRKFMGHSKKELFQ